ncbi:LuxR C-terminal-related transcriptional regulator [Streptomyces sp. NPDC101213]|uniref:helix-turn-helix transcriptional regulator n=1 Tax=Streptomyces sp. NPDC101213 TaxID=3366130 RepID=UPI00381EDE07
MTTSVHDTRTSRPLSAPPWPFTGREEELELLRGALGAGRPGVVVTGPPGVGRSRLAAEAVRGTDRGTDGVRVAGCVRVAGTPETRGTPFAAFAPLLPEGVTLHRAVRLLSGVRLLLVDDAHLLDDDSAAVVHQLAVQGRTRLLVLAADGVPAPDAVVRLRSGDLLPRLALEPLPRADVARLLAAVAGTGPEPLTVNRLHRLAAGDLGLLRDLLDALPDREPLDRGPLDRGPDGRGPDGRGPDGRGPDGREWRWRGPVPVTPALRERAAAVLGRSRPEEREVLDRLAFAEPLPVAATVEGLDLDVLERLEADGLVRADDDATVRLAHPLHGPLLRAAAGRLRARRLAAGRPPCGAALEAEAAELLRRIDAADVRSGAAPVGDWLVGEGEPVPAWYAAVRARFARLRGELREAVAWAREGLAGAPRDAGCLSELDCAAQGLGEEFAPAAPSRPDPGGHRPRTPAALGPGSALGPGPGSGSALGPGLGPGLASAPGPGLGRASPPDSPGGGAPGRAGHGPPDRTRGRGAPTGAGTPHRVGAGDAVRRAAPAGGVFARHAEALARGDGPGLDGVAAELAERGFLLFAAEAHAQAARLHRDPRAARTARTRAVALARRCQGARTPALAGLVLGELTARQRQIVTLAAAGLSNRQIAERLTLSVRTVGNHLYGAYTRLGASDRAALPWLVDLPDARTA